MSSRMEAALLASLKGVVFERGRRVLSGVSWELRERETWAVVGRNGAGKSTLLRVLAGEVPVSAGEVCYAAGGAGRSGRARWSDPSDTVRRVAFDAQGELLHGAAGYAQSRWHALEDADAARGRDVLGAARRTASGRRLVRALGLDRLLGRRVTQLSNGERRKLLLAREALRGPRILVLDNPLNGLDERSRRTLVVAVRRLQREGTSIVLATALEEEILPSVTHVLLLDRGRVVATGPREAIVADARFAKLMRPGSSARAGSLRRRPPRASRMKADEPSVVELRDVELRYGETRVLGSIDWVVRRGERWVVVGRNGAGKSALLSLVLADNPQAYANDVSVFGRERGSGDTIWEIRRRIGCVSPELHLFHHQGCTTLQVVSSGFHDSVGVYRRSSSSELRTARTWIRRLGITRCLERRFGALSEGEQQLALLGRALVKEPELLILDEPCQGLDAANQRRFRDLLNRVLQAIDTSMIYVTHDLEEVPSCVTHGLLLRRGRRALQGPVGSVLATYAR